MAFQTINGESGVDFIGSEGVDVLFALNETGEITADGAGGNDNITISDSDNVVGTATIKGGAGNDVITFADQDGTGLNSRILNSSVNGGAGDDDITLAGALSSVVRGNENNDDFTLTGNYTNSTINGNDGADTFGSTGILTLSNTKILGGNGNDGGITLGTGAGNSIVAVDATINGSKGVDNITIDNVSQATGFTVFGGQGNDTITNNGGAADADGIVLSGDLGDDNITAGGSDNSLSGGDGNDTITAAGGDDTIEGGSGNDVVTSGGGDDTVTLGDGNDTHTDGGGADTIRGGLGADTFAGAAGNDVYVYDTVTDSAATLTGSTNGFDTFALADLGDSIDITAFGTTLGGNTLTEGAEVIVGGAAAAAGVIGTANSLASDTFAELATRLGANGDLAASAANGATGTNQISAQIITVLGDGGANAAIDGTYIILNNNNAVLDAGDMMFEITGVAGGGEAAALTAFIADLNAGFAL